jgi:1,2-diacylglycerol 3-alpha-glucosyltransferase
MNIAFFTDTYLPQINGVVTSIEIFRQSLEREGHCVYIFCPQTELGQKKEDPDYVFRFKSAKLFFQPEYRLSWPFSRALNKFKKLNIDIIHSHTPFTMGMLAVFLANKYKKPLVHTYHTLFMEYVHYLPVPGDYAKNFVMWASKSFCNKNQLVIVPSKHILKELTDYKVVSPINIIPTGIPLTNYDDIFTDKILQEYTLAPDKCDYLISISRIAKEKNINFLLEAFAIIKKQRQNCKFILVGDGPEREAVEKKARELKIFEDIIMTGYIERKNIFPLLKIAKIFIFASKTETQGLVLLEAMSMKVPCIAVNSMGVSDILEDNIGGFLVNDSIVEFAQKVDFLLDEKELFLQKKEEAYQKSIYMSAERMTSKLLKSYSLLLCNEG